MDDWVSACRSFPVEGCKGRGRGRKTWRECVDEDMRKLNLHKDDAKDRETWIIGIRGYRLTRACMAKYT